MTGSVGESLEALRETIDRLPAADGTGPRAGPARSSTDEADELRWTALDHCLDGRVAGRRVLDIGTGGSHDAHAFAARGAEYVLACTPPGANWPVAAADEARVGLRAEGWEALEPERDGTFEIVHCHGLLHRVLEPMSLLAALRRMAAGQATLLIDSMMLADPERSELLRFVPDRHAGDPSCWFIPGRLAFRWMVETAGFEVEAELGETEGPRDGFPVVTGYLRARATETDA
ncbi:MAG: methyltransferase domain-containing protein [Solirubrobacteraceae bacterium]